MGSYIDYPPLPPKYNNLLYCITPCDFKELSLRIVNAVQYSHFTYEEMKWIELFIALAANQLLHKALW